MSSLAGLVSFETVDVATRVFPYRLAGDFSQAAQSVDAPLVVVPRSPKGFDPNLPSVQWSWQDTTAYATWLSANTGETWCLYYGRRMGFRSALAFP
jgi:formylglycine-generating enzyme required for sulfatase activity